LFSTNLQQTQHGRSMFSTDTTNVKRHRINNQSIKTHLLGCQLPMITGAVQPNKIDR